MLFSRTSAFFLAFACILLISWGCIGLTQSVDTTVTHGHNVKHNDGVIVTLGQNQDLVLMTSNGVHIQFRCVERCLVERDHIVRHIREHAHTDVYYVEMPDKKLAATDVD
jgi:hypothetical protein